MAADAVDAALKQGATDAECTVSEGEEFSVSVRMREVESVKEAGSRGAGVRVLAGQRTGSSPSDLSPEGIEDDGDARAGAREDHQRRSARGTAGSAQRSENWPGDLRMFDPRSSDWKRPKIEIAKRPGARRWIFDPRIQNSEGAASQPRIAARVLRRTREGSSAATVPRAAGLPCLRSPGEGASMERDYWYTAARFLSGLESRGGRRAHRRGARAPRV